MNGNSAFGWLKVIIVLSVAAIIGFVLWKGWKEIDALFKKISDFMKFGGGFDASNPISRGLDKPIAKATGGDSFGTLLARWFSPEAKAAEKAISAPVVLGGDDPYKDFVYDKPPTAKSDSKENLSPFLKGLFGS